jgi:hypothetical protein
LQSQSEPTPLPLRLRPDKSKVVIDISPDGIFAICRIDPAYPRALESNDIKIVLRTLARQHTVIANFGRYKEIVHSTEAGRQKLREFGLKDDEMSWSDDD